MPSQSGFQKPSIRSDSPQSTRHLSRARSSSSSTSTSTSSDRQIYLAKKEEQIPFDSIYDDIEYDSDDERFMQDLKFKRTPFQEKVHKAKKAFGAAVACTIILVVCSWLVYGLPNWAAERAARAWDNYADPRISEGTRKQINAGWKDSHSPS